MDPITSPAVLQALLKKHGLRPLKSLGQNFLMDSNILEAIADAAQLDEQTNCLEIGAGAGALTLRLSRRAKRVVSLEIDKGMLSLLQETLAGCDNVEIIHGDVLKQDLSQLTQAAWGNEPFVVAANLPYYITTPVIFQLLESGLPMQNMVLLMQKEVAARLCAQPGTKEYGALSVAVQYLCEVKTLFNVAPSCFMPRPQVESTLVRLQLQERPLPVSPQALSAVVRSLFAMRRKTLLNNLAARGMDKQQATACLQQAGIQPNQRAEALAIEDFIRLTQILENEG